MNICKDCQHCEIRSYVRDSPDLWRCRVPSNGIDPQTGKPRSVWCEHKNLDGKCSDFSRPGEAPREPEPPPEPPPRPYRSPLWIRIIRWFIQEG